MDADIDGLADVVGFMGDVEAPEIRRALQVLESFLIPQQKIAAAHRLLDRLARGDLLDVVHLVTIFREVGLLLLDIARLDPEPGLGGIQGRLQAGMHIPQGAPAPRPRPGSWIL